MKMNYMEYFKKWIFVALKMAVVVGILWPLMYLFIGLIQLNSIYAENVKGIFTIKFIIISIGKGTLIGFLLGFFIGLIENYLLYKESKKINR
jgi:hypothetical protein